MKGLVIGLAVAMVTAGSAGAAFVVTSKNIKNGTIPAGRHQRESEEGAARAAWPTRTAGAARAARHPGDYRGSGSRDRHSAGTERRRFCGLS